MSGEVTDLLTMPTDKALDREGNVGKREIDPIQILILYTGKKV